MISNCWESQQLQPSYDKVLCIPSKRSHGKNREAPLPFFLSIDLIFWYGSTGRFWPALAVAVFKPVA